MPIDICSFSREYNSWKTTIKYDMEPRDATGVIMNSPLTQELSANSGVNSNVPVEELAENYIR